MQINFLNATDSSHTSFIDKNKGFDDVTKDFIWLQYVPGDRFDVVSGKQRRAV
jgi:hypothetical protein